MFQIVPTGRRNSFLLSRFFHTHNNASSSNLSRCSFARCRGRRPTRSQSIRARRPALAAGSENRNRQCENKPIHGLSKTPAPTDPVSKPATIKKFVTTRRAPSDVIRGSKTIRQAAPIACGECRRCQAYMLGMFRYCTYECLRISSGATNAKCIRRIKPFSKWFIAFQNKGWQGCGSHETAALPCLYYYL